jgi:hypothetical protein
VEVGPRVPGQKRSGPQEGPAGPHGKSEGESGKGTVHTDPNSGSSTPKTPQGESRQAPPSERDFEALKDEDAQYGDPDAQAREEREGAKKRETKRRKQRKGERTEDEPAARDEDDAAARESEQAQKIHEERRREVEDLLSRAAKGEYSNWSISNKDTLFERFKRLVKEMGLPEGKAGNIQRSKKIADFHERLYGSEKARQEGRAQQPHLVGIPLPDDVDPRDVKPPGKKRPQSLAQVVRPDESGAKQLPDGRWVRTARELRSHERLQPGRSNTADAAEARAIARKDLADFTKKLPNLANDTVFIVEYKYTPDLAIQQEMLKELFTPGSPIYEVRFGSRTYRKAASPNAPVPWESF